MKTIDTRSLLIGVLATALVVTLTSSKSTAEGNNLEFVGYQFGFGLFNKSTNTFYIYKQSMNGNMPDKANVTYKVAADGSGLTKQE